MYKDKKVSIFKQYSRHWVILLIVGLSMICLLYGILKTSSTAPKSLINNKHFSTEIDYTTLLKDVQEEYRERCMNILQGKKNIDPDLMWSASFEDWYIYHNFFHDEVYHFTASNIDNREHGVYVDIGSYKPYFETNTAFFDICLGWTGICIWSPDLAVDQFANSDRSCNTIKRECLWSADQGFVGGHSDAFFCRKVDRYAHDILNEYVFHDRFGNDYEIKEEKFEIDFVSLRIEGAEASFIQCWDFKQFPVKVWSISTIDIYTKHVDELMLGIGYIKFDRLGFDGAQESMIYVKRDAIYPWTNTTKWSFHAPYKCDMVEPPQN